jgi:hypothetical protein
MQSKQPWRKRERERERMQSKQPFREREREREERERC